VALTHFMKDIISKWKRDSQLRKFFLKVNERKKVFRKDIAKIYNHARKSDKRKKKESRNVMIRDALPQIPSNIRRKHFILEKNPVIHDILDDFFKKQGENIYKNNILINDHDVEIIKIVRDCMDINKDENIKTYIQFFSDNINPPAERTLRFRSMTWFAYLIIVILKKDQNACEEGATYIKNKLMEILQAVIDENIDNRKNSDPLDQGLWSETIFAHLEKGIAERLLKQFNFKNIVEHGNLRLLSRHRKCMFKTAHTIICKQNLNEE